MEKMRILASMLFCMLLFAGCDVIVKKMEIDEKYIAKKTGINGNGIVGTWYCNETEEMFVFYSNGICMHFWGRSLADDITYTVSGKEVKLFKDGKQVLFGFTITYDGWDAFSISGIFEGDEYYFYFERVSSGSIEGVWQNAKFNRTYAFKPNATGIIKDANDVHNFTYKTSDKNVSIINRDDFVCDAFFEDENGNVFIRQ